MPGEPIGMPGTERPTMSGRSSSRRRITSAGTCPSITYPSITAVWHAVRLELTMCSRFTAAISDTYSVVTSKPSSRKCSAHLPQQPQVGDAYTSTSAGAALAREVHDSAAADTVTVAAATAIVPQ